MNFNIFLTLRFTICFYQGVDKEVNGCDLECVVVIKIASLYEFVP